MVLKKQQENERVEVNFRDILPPALYNFYYRGILDLIDNEEETSVRIPVDLAEEIEEIIFETEFKKQIKQNKEHKSFARGLLLYYGALKANQLIEFYDQYFEAGDDQKEFFHFLMLVEETYLSTYDLERHNHYYLDPGVLNPEAIIDEIQMRPNVDYYLPLKKEILYAGTNEQEKLNSVQRKFKKMLINDFPIEQDEAEDILWEMMLDIKNDLSSIKLLQDFTSKYEFESEEQTDKFIRLLNEVHNNTRMWILKGHTPNELFKEEKKHLQPLPKKEADGSVGEQTIVKGEKVGRNDPCPCGSGKKYKKCCLGKEN
jgi:hypothetical protein